MYCSVFIEPYGCSMFESRFMVAAAHDEDWLEGWADPVYLHTSCYHVQSLVPKGTFTNMVEF